MLQASKYLFTNPKQMAHTCTCMNRREWRKPQHILQAAFNSDLVVSFTPYDSTDKLANAWQHL